MSDALFHDAVIAFLIQYVGLGLVFVLGLVIAIKQGDLGTKTPRQRRWLGLMIGGYLGYASVHALFQFVLVDL